MKWLVFLPVMLVFLSNSWSAEGDLKPFCQNLDKSLRALNSSTPPAQCPAKTPPLYGKISKYKGKTTTFLTPQQAQDLFKEMASQQHIGFKFPANGCADRSNEMTRLMLLKGIKPLSGFLWVNPDNQKEIDETGAEPSYSHLLQFPDKDKPNDPWKWTQHVAPIVIVQEKGKQVPYVIDPSTEQKAVPMTEWQKKLSQHDKKIKVHSEIGRTGQFTAGSPLDFDFQDSNQLNHLKARIDQYKGYEQSPTGFQDFQADEQTDYENSEGKWQAMSGGK